MLNIRKSEFEKLIGFMKVKYGIDLSQKKTLIEGRLSNIILDKGFKGFDDYLNFVFLDKTGSEANLLVNKLTTNHTFFMREASHFDYFKDVVLPYISANSKDKDLRIWSAGCSTGEEPYTIAMILKDFFMGEKVKWDTKVLATDISHRALESASQGIFSSEDINNIPAVWRLKYFEKIDRDTYKISEKIKEEVLLRVFNLMEENYPFRKKFHVIFCRNVMIYFDKNTKTELINKFYKHTEPGGYLFIGHSESISRENTMYQYVMPAVYRKEMN